MHMGSAFQKMFDILFPPSQDELLVRTLSAHDMPTLLKPRTKDSVTILSHFQNEYISALIHEAKFHNNIHAIKLLSVILNTYLETNIIDRKSILIPIPLSKIRQRERGYNQVTEVAKKIARNRNLEMNEKILKRIHHTTPQTELSRKERLQNVIGVFEIDDRNSLSLKNGQLILIDDVVTTGATLEAARTALLKAYPVRVVCVALAG
jgi:ComF family protein